MGRNVINPRVNRNVINQTTCKRRSSAATILNSPARRCTSLYLGGRSGQRAHHCLCHSICTIPNTFQLFKVSPIPEPPSNCSRCLLSPNPPLARDAYYPRPLPIVRGVSYPRILPLFRVCPIQTTANPFFLLEVSPIPKLHHAQTITNPFRVPITYTQGVTSYPMGEDGTT